MEPRHVRVLLIDDDEFAFKVVSADLADAKTTRFEVTWEKNWSGGLKALLDAKPDVCLLDYQLGDRSGLDLLKEAVTLGCRVPVVMLTAQLGDGVDVEAMRAGATDYLIKGEFGAPLLERALRYAIERAHTLEALRESEERYALATAGANDGLWDWKVKANRAHFSARWKAIFGYEAQEIPDEIDAWHSRVHPDDAPRLQEAIGAHLEGRASTFECEHRILHKDGTYRWVVVRGAAVRDAQGRGVRIAGSLRDVTLTRGYDALTGLPNRALYIDCLARVLDRAKRRQSFTFAVLFLDLDRFKIVNDSLGHLAGDQLLVEIAKRLRSCVRTADTVARLGGDEFTLLVEDIFTPTDAVRVAKRVHRALSLPVKVEGREVFTTISIGIAMGSASYQRPEEILRDADTAMYHAKTTRNAHQVFDARMHAAAVEVLQLEGNLRRAVESRAFDVHYQPIVSLDSGQVLGFEALARWHTDSGWVAPQEFIPLAEETGLILDIDRCVLQMAVSQLAQWRARFPEHAGLELAVNVSKRHLAQADFVEHLIQVLEKAGLPPSALSLELTESAILESDEQAERVLTEARAHQMKLVMDDFGTGYSSLSYLHRLPFTSLKVDRSFVEPLTTGGTTEIVRAVLTLARGLKLEATAEGVTSAAHARLLRELGCHRAQGFHFSAPVTSATAEEWLTRPQAFSAQIP